MLSEDSATVLDLSLKQYLSDSVGNLFKKLCRALTLFIMCMTGFSFLLEAFGLEILQSRVSCFLFVCFLSPFFLFLVFFGLGYVEGWFFFGGSSIELY